MKVIYKRPDGTFLAHLNGMPYHVIRGDPLFEEAALAGADAPFEPQPQQAAPDMQELRRAARAEAARMIDGACAQITGPVPEYERDSWPTKAAAAEAVLSGTASAEQVAMIAAEAAILGEAPEEVAALVAARAAAWSVVIAEMSARRQIAAQAINDAADPAAVEAALAALRTTLDRL